MTEAQRAHFRLLSSTPRERIHTHERSFVDRQHGKKIGAVPAVLVEEVRGMILNDGKSRMAVCRELAMGDRLYARILRTIQQQWDVVERRRIISELIAKGVPERRVASIIGISRTAVQKHKRALKRAADRHLADIPKL